jgi:hypothetical protein
VATSLPLGEGKHVLDGYQVNLVQLEDYTQALVDTQLLYDQIEYQLTEADLATKDPSFGTLIGHPQYAGPQSDFTEACRTFLATYTDSTRRSTH